MVVNSFNIEFGYELLSAVPYAYELHLAGKLEATCSAQGSEPLYYFSKKHTINKAPRSWFNTKVARENGLPYTDIHKAEQPDKTFPPYREAFANKEFKWKKPTLCICNRFNIEWSARPINYFSTDLLRTMFQELSPLYEIVYFPVSLPEELQDQAHSLDMKDVELAKSFGVKVFTEIKGKHSWNEALLMVFSNCEHFITMNGGYSILASMFKGTNIIYSKPGVPQSRELGVKSFWRWYPNINGVRTLHVESYDELRSKIKALYIDKKPCMNILVRTHRPNYLATCAGSIASQDYENINVVFLCDSQLGVVGCRPYNGRIVRVHPSPVPIKKPLGGEYGIQFPYNEYLNVGKQLVTGFVMVLDDDDLFLRKDSVSKIMSVARKDTLTVWKSDFKAMGIKPSRSFGKEIELFDIGAISFCWHTDHNDMTDWSPWKRADYRTAKNLASKLGIEWIDDILTGIQDRLGMGTKKDLSSARPLHYRLKYPDGRIEEQYFTAIEIDSFKPTYQRQGICIEQIQ